MQHRCISFLNVRHRTFASLLAQVLEQIYLRTGYCRDFANFFWQKQRNRRFEGRKNLKQEKGTLKKGELQ